MVNQMTKERKEAYVEVLEILKCMDKQYVEKVPLNLIKFFENNAAKEYKFHIDLSIPLEKHKLKQNTINILAMININYWCETEEHKQELLKKYHENELKYQEELRRKYNTDNLFKREAKVVMSSQHQESINTFPLQYTELKWYEKIYNVIQKLIKRVFNKV